VRLAIERLEFNSVARFDPYKRIIEYVVGLRQPRGTEKQRKLRRKAIQEGLKTAVDVPLTNMRIGRLGL
jgi:formiminotetrahydrofolate cyclodeaminase